MPCHAIFTASNSSTGTSSAAQASRFDDAGAPMLANQLERLEFWYNC